MFCSFFETGGVTALVFSSDDSMLFSGGEKGDIKMWSPDLENIYNFGAIHESIFGANC